MKKGAEGLNREQEYARLLARVGLNIQPGQRAVLSAPVACADFARLCVRELYDAGCGEVVLNWHDDAVTRMRYLYAADNIFDEVPEWRKHFFNDHAREGAAYLAISATDPENLLGVNQDRLVRNLRASGKALKPFDDLQMASAFPWCIASVPIPSWARKVFPEAEEPQAVEELWEAIFQAVRVTGDGKAVERWQEHLAHLHRRVEMLNAFQFQSLHYENALGTDLTIRLPERHVWEAGDDRTPQGQSFIANLPTEEIFTAPLRGGADGVVYGALPLVHDGNVIDDFRFVVREGKIVEATAEQGEEALQAAISVDEGARYFGEVALVPYDSPISNQRLLYYNTLFDENAACHIAFGEAYPCIEGGRDLTREELAERGLNNSATHVDFMVGTADLRITGTTPAGETVEVFTNGNFSPVFA